MSLPAGTLLGDASPVGAPPAPPPPHVLVFSKYPHAGHAKTRLIPALGAAGAADVSRALTERCVATVRAFCATTGARALLHYAGRDGEDAEEAIRAWLCDGAAGGSGSELGLVAQRGDGLGERLAAAFAASYAGAPARLVVVVGADVPELSGALLAAALEALDTADVVVGPAADGGYYLLGTRARADTLFERVTWGTATVLEETKRNAAAAGLSLACLPVLRDVDDPEDLEYYRSVCEGH